VSSGGLSRLSVKRGALRQLACKGVANASLVAIEPAPSLFQSLVFGLNGDWFGDDGECLRSAESWRSTLTRSGLSRARAEATAHGAERSIDIVARAPEAPSPSALVAGTISPAVEVLIVHDGSGPDDFALALKQALAQRGAACGLAEGAESATSPGSASPIQCLAASRRRRRRSPARRGSMSRSEDSRNRPRLS